VRSTSLGTGGPGFLGCVLEMAELIIELMESRSQIVFEALPVDDPQVRQPDLTRAKQLLGWEPEIDVRGGLRRSIAHYTKVLRQTVRHPANVGAVGMR
jgi:dTDP-glucose 4,6-dehydratase